MNKSIQFLDLKKQYLTIKKEINQAIKEVYNKSIFVGGEQVDQFESDFSSYLGAKYCISVNSGTDALILGIRGLNLDEGSEIIVPGNTFLATALSVSENGLKPVFVDVDEADFGINLVDLKRKINSRTKAIILVHLYGQPDKLDEVKSIIKKTGKKIYLIEDACQAHGAKYKDKKVGNFGIFSAFSFYPGKNLGAYGDGGAIVTNNTYLAKIYRKLRQYGSDEKYYHDIIGVNSRLDTIQATILSVKLKYLDRWNSSRQKLALYYDKLISYYLPNIQFLKTDLKRKSVYHVYPIIVEKRDLLIQYLTKNSITTLIHYPLPLHLQKAYQYLGYKKGDLPIVERNSNRLLSLPIYPELKKTTIDRIVKNIYNFYH